MAFSDRDFCSPVGLDANRESASARRYAEVYPLRVKDHCCIIACVHITPSDSSIYNHFQPRSLHTNYPTSYIVGYETHPASHLSGVAMADVGVDIGQLTEDQQLALQQFTSVTDQDIKDAVPLLERCQWNVQVSESTPSVVISANMAVDRNRPLLRRRTSRRPRSCSCRASTPARHPPTRDVAQWLHQLTSFLYLRPPHTNRTCAPRCATAGKPGDDTGPVGSDDPIRSVQSGVFATLEVLPFHGPYLSIPSADMGTGYGQQRQCAGFASADRRAPAVEPAGYGSAAHSGD